VPWARVGFGGLIEIETSAGTETVVLPVMIAPIKPVPHAVIVAVPALNPDTSPELFTLVAAGLDDAQLTLLVRFCTLPFVNVPMAVSCKVVPGCTVGFTGVTAMDISAGGATVSKVDPVGREEKVAEIVVLPCVRLVASPELFTDATAGFVDIHAATLVRSCVLWSVRMPTALNCWLTPRGTVGLCG